METKNPAEAGSLERLNFIYNPSAALSFANSVGLSKIMSVKDLISNAVCVGGLGSIN